MTPLEDQLRSGLTAHVDLLAGTIGERNLWHYSRLVEAADHIERSFRQLGYTVESQAYAVGERQVRNLVAELPGEGRADEIVLVGAHYDSVPGSPGANDNATGVAAVLELARVFSGQRLPRTLRLVAFVNEEPPFFQTAQMGSLRYARRCRDRDERIVAMLCLETIGYYSTAPGSQRYPFPMGFFHPTTADFIGFVANLASRGLNRRVVAAFRRHTNFPCEGAVAPAWIPGVDWSDHWAFWKVGYPAVMVTDTALFRYAHYHLPEDTPDKVDYEGTARVVGGLIGVVEELARQP